METGKRMTGGMESRAALTLYLAVSKVMPSAMSLPVTLFTKIVAGPVVACRLLPMADGVWGSGMAKPTWGSALVKPRRPFTVRSLIFLRWLPCRGAMKSLVKSLTENVCSTFWNCLPTKLLSTEPIRGVFRRSESDQWVSRGSAAAMGYSRLKG